MPDNKSEIPGAPTLDPALNHPHYNKCQAQSEPLQLKTLILLTVSKRWENFTPSHQKVRSLWNMNLWVITNYARGRQFLSCGPWTVVHCAGLARPDQLVTGHRPQSGTGRHPDQACTESQHCEWCQVRVQQWGHQGTVMSVMMVVIVITDHSDIIIRWGGAPTRARLRCRRNFRDL